MDSSIYWMYFNVQPLSPLTVNPTVFLWICLNLSPLICSPSLYSDVTFISLFSFPFPFSYWSWEMGEFSSLSWWGRYCLGKLIGFDSFPCTPQRTDHSIIFVLLLFWMIYINKQIILKAAPDVKWGCHLITADLSLPSDQLMSTVPPPRTFSPLTDPSFQDEGSAGR